MVNGTAIPVTIEDDSDIGDDDDDDDDDDDSALAYVRRHLPEAAGRWPKAATAELEARLWRRWRGRRGARGFWAHSRSDLAAMKPRALRCHRPPEALPIWRPRGRCFYGPARAFLHIS